MTLGLVAAPPLLPEDPAPPGPGPCGLVWPFGKGSGLWCVPSGSDVTATSDSRVFFAASPLLPEDSASSGPGPCGLVWSFC